MWFTVWFHSRTGIRRLDLPGGDPGDAGRAAWDADGTDAILCGEQELPGRDPENRPTVGAAAATSAVWVYFSPDHNHRAGY